MRMLTEFLRVMKAHKQGDPYEMAFGPRRKRFFLYPDGSMLPALAGGSPELDEDPETDPPAEDPEVDPEEDPADPDPDEDPETDPPADPEDDFDRDRALRTIRKQRAKEKQEREARKKAEEERDALLREKETEQERTVRELGEAQSQLERERERSRTVSIDLALRDAAAEEGVPVKKVKRLLRIVDRSEISVDEDGEVEGAEEAVSDLLEEFPEFRAQPTPPADEEDEEPVKPKRTPGANPDRKRGKGGELTAKQAARMARDEPGKFAELLAEGKIPREALGGKEYDRLKASGKLDAHSVAAEDGLG